MNAFTHLRPLPQKAGSFSRGVDGALVQPAMHLNTGASCIRGELELRADLIRPEWRDEVAHARFLPEMTVVDAIPSVRHPRPDVDRSEDPAVMLAHATVAIGLRAERRLIQKAVGKAA